MQCLINAGLNVTSVRGNFYMNESPFEKRNRQQTFQKKGYFSSCPRGLQELVRVCANDIVEASSGRLFGGGNPTDTSNKCYNITDPEPHSPCTRFASDLSDAALGKKRSSTNPRISSSLELLQQYRSAQGDLLQRLPGQQRAIWRNGSRGALFLRGGAIFNKGEDAFKDLASVEKGLSLQYDL